MKSLKKIFWTGLITVFVIWIFVSMGKLIYNLLAPLRDLIHLISKHPIPGLEFVLGIVAIILLGLVVTHIKLPTSKIPIISKISWLIHSIKNAGSRLEAGKIVAVQVKFSNNLSVLGFTSGKSLIIDGKKMIVVLLPSTPNPVTGYVFTVPEDQITYLPDLSKAVLKIIVTGGLINDDEQ